MHTKRRHGELSAPVDAELAKSVENELEVIGPRSQQFIQALVKGS